MAFPLDDQLLGAPAYGRRRGTEGIVWHTTEGADTSRNAAVATARWQATPGATTGSYNWIVFDGGLLLTVPYLDASGGLATGVQPYWQPDRFPFLKANLSLSAYADPNAFLLNVSFSGKAAEFAAGNMPQNMVDTAVALTRWVEAQDWSSRPLVHSGHMHWQTNRSDPSQTVLDAIARAYGDDMAIFTRPVREQWDIPAGMEFWTGGPDMGERKTFSAPIRLWSNGETLDGKWRRLEYEDSPGSGEELWADGARATRKMKPVPGSRNPVSGFGTPVLSAGFTQEQLDAEKAKANEAGFGNAKAQAIVAAENHLSVVRSLT